jgi:hypothetical protein
MTTKEKRAEYNRRYRERHPDKVKECDARWRKRNPEKVRAAAKRQRERYPEKVAERTRDWRERHPEQVEGHTRAFHERNPGYKAQATKKQYYRHLEKGRARSALTSAVHAGRITKPSHCERCGDRVSDPTDLHGHHHDYSKPLEVEWLCRGCHGGEHH